MMTLLLIVICIIFIGLGLPDSVLGASWPSIYPDLNIPVGNASFITIIMSVCTAISSYFSARVINKFGTPMVTCVSTAMTALALLGFSYANSLYWMLLLGIPLGIGAGAIDSGLNNFVATHYSSSQMNFLHAFYGVGVAISPYIISLMLNAFGDWRLGYRAVFYIQLGITVLSIISLPLWKKTNKNQPEEQKFTPITLSLKQILKIPAERVAWVAFFATCALEFTCGIWGCTFLVSSEGLNEALAAKIITFYYVGMTAGRLTSGFVSKKMKPKALIATGYSLVGVALIMLTIPIPPIVKGVALFMVGFGNGPTFPTLTYLTPINFGKDISQSLIGTQMVVSNLGICLMPPLFGLIAQYITVALYPYFLIVVYVFMVVFTILYFKLPKNTSKDLFSKT